MHYLRVIWQTYMTTSPPNWLDLKPGTSALGHGARGTLVASGLRSWVADFAC